MDLPFDVVYIVPICFISFLILIAIVDKSFYKHQLELKRKKKKK